MDNAENNDTMLMEVEKHIKMLGIEYDFKTRRLLCIGHIINISVKAFLFGNSKMAIENKTYIEGTEELLVKVHKFGPLGKAHNWSVHTHASPQRQQEFKIPSGGRLLRRDNEIRWNS